MFSMEQAEKYILNDIYIKGQHKGMRLVTSRGMGWTYKPDNKIAQGNNE